MSVKGDVSSAEKTGYMAFNFLSSVGIITVNKVLFKTYGYNFSTLLTGFHFTATVLGLLVCNRLGMFTIKKVPLRDTLALSLSFIGFVCFTNLSLQYNSVGFYQLMKVLTTPVIVIIQFVLFGVPLHNKLKLALVPICLGVAMATVNDVEVNFVGTFWAIAGIISTSFYQIWVKSKQQDLGLNSYQLLYCQAPPSALLVFILAFLTEPVGGPHGFMGFNYTTPAVSAIILSSILAFCVNLSIFLVIGKTSPIAYNVLGHFKLCVILISGYVMFGEDMNPAKAMGTALAFAGVVLYTHFQQTLSNGWEQRKAAPASPVEGKDRVPEATIEVTGSERQR